MRQKAKGSHSAGWKRPGGVALFFALLTVCHPNGSVLEAGDAIANISVPVALPFTWLGAVRTYCIR